MKIGGRVPSLSFLMTQPNSIESPGTFFSTKYRNFFKTYFCRETMVRDFNARSTLFSDAIRANFRDEFLNFGVRMFGPQYNIVANVLKTHPRKDRISALEKFLSNFLEYPVKLEIGEFTKSEFVPVPFSYTIENTRILNNSYITIKFLVSNFPKNSFMFNLSAILALLKEPKVIEHLLSIKVPLNKDATLSFIRLFSERLMGEDESYFCPTSAGFNQKSMRIAKFSLKNFVLNYSNDDGSDFYSTFCLGMYFMIKPKVLSIYELSLLKGPVEIITSFCDRLLKKPEFICMREIFSDLSMEELEKLYRSIKLLNMLRRANFHSTILSMLLELICQNK